MAGFFGKLRTASTGNSNGASTSSSKNKKEEPAPELTPLERLLHNAGALREDGSDKFFGLENFGNTCYCNSILQALYYSESFRDNVVKYPPYSPSNTPNGKPSKVNVSIRAMPQLNGEATAPGKGGKALTPAQALKQRQQINAGQVTPGGQPVRPEDKPDSPEYKKKQAMIKGPVLELASENPGAYGMEECTFTGLKDIFQALIESNTRTGVLSPQRFLEIFKRDNEMFRNAMHQDAHEFYGLVLNDVITAVETFARRMLEREDQGSRDGLSQSLETALGASSALSKNRPSGTMSPGTGWVHDIFEGVLTSETRCLTCETTSQRDETFLDLSIDLEEHSSVTSCLSKFSAEEMLCERNKFHCDHCGGLQEAEKRMKVKKLPKVLALHLKRFKYTEDFSRLQKLFHRVVYPYYLRMFNTTDDAEDQDRMYELYGVVVHIGGNAYHGHYVSVIKTKDRGWLLFDDEMVEPVDKHFVSNFFGDKPGMACAYVLFYQEISFEKMREELDAEGLEEVRLASEQADLVTDPIHTNGIGSHGLSKIHTAATPMTPIEIEDMMISLDHARTAPGEVSTPIPPTTVEPPLPSASLPLSPIHEKKVEDVPKSPAAAPVKSKEDKFREKKELKAQEKELKAQEKKLKAQEKARKAAQKEEAKLADKKRIESQARLVESRKSEHEQMQKALQESKQTAANEEKQRMKKAATAPMPPQTPNGDKSEKGAKGLLSRANRGSRSMSRKSFSFLAKGEKEKDKEKDKDQAGRSSTADSRPNGSEASASTSRTATTQQTTLDEAPVPGPVRISTSKERVHDSKPLRERFSFGRKKSGKFQS